MPASGGSAPVGSKSAPLRGIRTGASVAAIVTAVAFAGAILALSGSGVIVHEVAGLVLLVLILTALSAAWRLRASDPRPIPRLVGALLALVLTGSLGAALAVGSLPSWADLLPLGGLAVLVLLLADSLRVGLFIPMG